MGFRCKKKLPRKERETLTDSFLFYYIITLLAFVKYTWEAGCMSLCLLNVCSYRLYIPASPLLFFYCSSIRGSAGDGRSKLLLFSSIDLMKNWSTIFSENYLSALYHILYLNIRLFEYPILYLGKFCSGSGISFTYIKIFYIIFTYIYII